MAFETRIKDPSDKLDYLIDWQDGDKPGLAPGETILTSVWAAYDTAWAATTDLIVHEDLNDNTATTAVGWASGGTRGQDYYFTNHIVTDQGRALSLSYKLKIREQ